MDAFSSSNNSNLNIGNGRGYYTRRDMAHTGRSPHPTHPASPLLIYRFFLLYNLSGVSRFLLLFTFFWSEIFKIWPFSLHSRVLCFLFFYLLQCVCVGGGRSAVGVGCLEETELHFLLCLYNLYPYTVEKVLFLSQFFKVRYWWISSQVP